MPPTAAADEAPPDNSIAWHLWVGVLTTGIPAALAVILRFYARMKGRIPLKADDWLIVGALVGNTMSVPCIRPATDRIVAFGMGNGRPPL
ncbi:MAG: hypothetical protein INR62_10695, partial [Rhodospirillales bacterium]|nr:hypothetical protein [Acetobacter sp.]